MLPNWLTLLLLTLCTTTTTTIAQQLSLPDTPSLDLRLNQTICDTADQTCLCHDDAFLKHVQGCVIMSCPLKYALESQNITWTACDFPLHDGAPATRVARIVVFISLPTLSIILRIITKFARLSPCGLDDYTIFVAYLLLVAYTSLHVYLEHNGAGRDLWTLTDDQITTYFKAFYALQTLYHSCIDMIKASILFMYLRIFHLPDEKIRIALWITMGINFMSGIIFIFVGLFQCQPVSLAWTFWTGEATGKCIDIVQLALSHAGINITLDLWMLVLPATQIWGMNLALRKKIAIMSMFSLGLFLTVVSIIRIPAILDFRKEPLNPTVAMMPSVIWSDIELNVGIFTACIPNLRQFFVRFILGQSEKKKRLTSIALSNSEDPKSMPKSQTLTQQLSELDTMDESHDSSPCQKYKTSIQNEMQIVN
ncbi:cfem domain-containing protein [Colletotrichum incanum]|uniref:Cfem domain-containing protein n=1 Tax=Colletotrichum incanum TaxID=1573173 RepID=A0A166VGI2_COLIC|nr:cfem domain-containing protein [Colletotrichum incanum]OHW99056.1 CFEM domain-containing protein [Colletotrichum incanum]